MRIYLIRHAQSEENALDLESLTSIADFNALMERSHAAALTPLGETQARAVVERLAEAQIGRLYSSPFVRALSTATALGDALGLVPEPVDALRELLARPLGTDVQPATLRRLFLRSYAGMLWPRGADETWLAGYSRSRQAWDHITADTTHDVAAVSHTALIALILLRLRRSTHWRVVSRDLANGGISIVEPKTI